MIKLIGIAGSLRLKSLNASLLRAAANSASLGVEIQIEPLDQIPLYNEDIERSDFPPAVTRIKELLSAADGLLIVTPEYNNSLPGVLKNAIDWISRPAADVPRVFAGLPVAVIGASPGGFGTVLAQTAWLPVIRSLGMQPWYGNRITLAHAQEVFGVDGTLADRTLEAKLKDFLLGFAGFATRARRLPS